MKNKLITDAERAEWCLRLAKELKDIMYEVRMLPSEHQEMFSARQTLLKAAAEYKRMAMPD